MLISELIAALTVMQNERGNLHVMMADGWAITGAESTIVTQEQADDWMNMTVGDRFVTLTDAR